MKTAIVLSLAIVVVCHASAQVATEDGLFVFGHSTSDDFERTVRLANLFDPATEPVIIPTHESVRIEHGDAAGRKFHIVYGADYTIHSIHIHISGDHASEKNVREAQQQIIGFVSNLQGVGCHAAITPDGVYEFLADVALVDAERSAIVQGYLKDGHAQMQIKLYDSSDLAQKIWDASLETLKAHQVDLPGGVKRSTYLGKAPIAGSLQFLDGKVEKRRKKEAKENRPAEEKALELQKELLGP